MKPPNIASSRNTPCISEELPFKKAIIVALLKSQNYKATLTQINLNIYTHKHHHHHGRYPNEFSKAVLTDFFSSICGRYSPFLRFVPRSKLDLESSDWLWIVYNPFRALYMFDFGTFDEYKVLLFTILFEYCCPSIFSILSILELHLEAGLLL